MSLTIDPAKVSSILLASHGWYGITPGSFTIDDLIVSPEVTEAEDYGFTCVNDSGTGRITGRLSALLAVEQTGR